MPSRFFEEQFQKYVGSAPLPKTLNLSDEELEQLDLKRVVREKAERGLVGDLPRGVEVLDGKEPEEARATETFVAGVMASDVIEGATREDADSFLAHTPETSSRHSPANSLEMGSVALEDTTGGSDDDDEISFGLPGDVPAVAPDPFQYGDDELEDEDGEEEFSDTPYNAEDEEEDAEAEDVEADLDNDDFDEEDDYDYDAVIPLEGEEDAEEVEVIEKEEKQGAFVPFGDEADWLTRRDAQVAQVSVDIKSIENTLPSLEVQARPVYWTGFQIYLQKRLISLVRADADPALIQVITELSAADTVIAWVYLTADVEAAAFMEQAQSYKKKVQKPKKKKGKAKKGDAGADEEKKDEEPKVTFTPQPFLPEKVRQIAEACRSPFETVAR